MEHQKIKVVIVDDHLLFRMGLRSVFSNSGSSIEVLAEAGSAAEFFEQMEKCQPDVVLLDIILPDLSGVEIARRLRQDYPQVRILILSAETSEGTLRKLVELGVDGFIGKSVSDEELCMAVEYVAEGAEYLGKDIARLIHYVRVAQNDTQVEFTERENDIVALCAKGYSAKEIADALYISIGTVNTHKNNIFRKLGINNSVELVLYALKKGIIEL